MADPLPHRLSRRERQIMDVLFRLEQASVAEVRKELPNPPSYSAVRAHLRILEEKGHVSHVQDGPRYSYSPNMPIEKAKRSALAHVADTFFGGSAAQMMSALLDQGAGELSDSELDRMSALIERARREEGEG